MIEHLNTFDYSILGIVALSCLFAFFRGLVREILSLLAWVGAAAITIHYYPLALEKLTPHFKSETTAIAIAVSGVYIAALMAFAIVNIMIMKTIKSGGDAGMLDNLLGLFFGAARGAFVVVLGYFLITVAIPDEKNYPAWLAKAQTRPYLEEGAILMARVAPDTMRRISSLQKKAEERMDQAKESRKKAYENDDAYNREMDEGKGYSKSSSRELNRLIDNSNNPSR